MSKLPWVATTETRIYIVAAAVISFAKMAYEAATASDIFCCASVRRGRRTARFGNGVTGRGTGEPSGDGRAGKAASDVGEWAAGVCRREKCYAATRQRRTVGRWEKSPSQPCPSMCGGKPPVLLTVCLRKRRWPVRRRQARSKRPFCRRGHCFCTLFADVWDGETRWSVEARSIVRPFWRARGNDVTAGTASVRFSISVAPPRWLPRLCPPATQSLRTCLGG